MKPDHDLAEIKRAQKAALFVVAAFVITAACVCALVVLFSL